MTRLRVDGKPMRGYSMWLLAEYNPSDGRRMRPYYIYEAPEDVVAEMIAQGAKIDSPTGQEGCDGS